MTTAAYPNDVLLKEDDSVYINLVNGARVNIQAEKDCIKIRAVEYIDFLVLPGVSNFFTVQVVMDRKPSSLIVETQDNEELHFESRMTMRIQLPNRISFEISATKDLISICGNNVHKLLISSISANFIEVTW